MRYLLGATTISRDRIAAMIKLDVEGKELTEARAEVLRLLLDYRSVGDAGKQVDRHHEATSNLRRLTERLPEKVKREGGKVVRPNPAYLDAKRTYDFTRDKRFLRYLRCITFRIPDCEKKNAFKVEKRGYTWRWEVRTQIAQDRVVIKFWDKNSISTDAELTWREPGSATKALPRYSDRYVITGTFEPLYAAFKKHRSGVLNKTVELYVEVFNRNGRARLFSSKKIKGGVWELDITRNGHIFKAKQLS